MHHRRWLWMVLVPALLAGVAARAQPAPTARPLGGQVVAGAASISASGTTVLVKFRSESAAIDWSGFH